MNKISLKKNFILNLIKTLMGVLFPLISFPYASRILGPIGIGKINYCTSLISYFGLIASLGISTYAIREGAKIRDNKNKLGKFSSEIIIINICTTVISYILLFTFIFFFKKIYMYRKLLLICSLSIIFTTLSIEWIYNIYEDFEYITFRSIMFQVLSLLALLFFVTQEDDYYIYALITVFSAGGSCIFNLIHSRKYIKLFCYCHYNISNHIKPILIIFGTSIAATIYLNLDTTMLGYLKGDTQVGLYSAAIKINGVIKTLISSASMVLLPRLSFYIANGYEEQFQSLVKKGCNCILILAIPMATGLFILSDELILLFSGNSFLLAGNISKILAPDLIFATLNGYITYQIFVPYNKEIFALISTILGAITNITLNSITIPIYGASGAAFATVFTEFIIFCISLILCKQKLHVKGIFSEIPKYLLSSTVIVLLYYFSKTAINNYKFVFCFTVLLSSIFYFILLIILKNPYIFTIYRRFKICIERMIKKSE